MLGLTSSESSLALVIVYVFITGAFILAGRVSQRIGRRRFLMIWGLVVAILGTASYGVLMGMVGAGFLLIVVMATVTSILTISNWGVTTAYISERFALGVRSSGFGMGYTLSVIIPSLYSFFITWLSGIMPAAFAPLPLVFIGGILILVGAAMGPETRKVELGSRT